ncbi:hypothetical protein O3G_MSEX009157 [Manduca sexta]|uniref:Uncharacterized protein n=2 Tax=Manduca sexta TaxID=7130 RepID=A0A921ZD25_MANSE|nr:hypothetical protein O3G_MSEX009157 [Manduca sexta]
MRTHKIIIFVFILLASKVTLSYPSDVASAFRCSKLVPNITPCAPTRELQVSYPQGNFVYLGKMLTPAETVKAPGIEFIANSSKYYTLIMVDPDIPIPSNTTRSEFRHWIIGNIPGDDIYSAETLADYISPVPVPGSGAHRYTFLVYEQKGYIKFKETKLKAIPSPARFVPIQKFVDKYDLGCPLFGNYFCSAL